MSDHIPFPMHAEGNLLTHFLRYAEQPVSVVISAFFGFLQQIPLCKNHPL